MCNVPIPGTCTSTTVPRFRYFGIEAGAGAGGCSGKISLPRGSRMKLDKYASEPQVGKTTPRRPDLFSFARLDRVFVELWRLTPGDLI